MIVAHSLPQTFNPSKVDPTDNPAASRPHLYPLVEANITNQNGSDISSSFRVMIYSPTKFITTTDLNSRSEEVDFGTIMNICHSRPNTIFVTSRCDRQGAQGSSGSIQAYSITCRAPDDTSHPSLILFSETGKCTDDEICVDESVPGKLTPNKAYCVKKSNFRWVDDPKPRPMYLGSRNVSLAVSEGDGKTPLKMESIEVTASDVSGSDGSYQAIREGSCEDCVDVSTQTLPSTVGFVTTTGRAMLPVAMHTVVWGVLWMLFLPA